MAKRMDGRGGILKKLLVPLTPSSVCIGLHAAYVKLEILQRSGREFAHAKSAN